jgi:hypothetical protein
MSAIHSNVHVVEHATARERGAKVEVRDQREVKAQPIARDHRQARKQPIVRDHRDAEIRVDDRDRDRPIVVEAPTYVTTAAPLPSNGYEPQSIALLGSTSLASGQLSIDTTNLLAGRATLQIESTGTGSTYVTTVLLYDTNGNYEVMNVNAMLSAQNPAVDLPLASSAGIVRIAIDGHSDWGGAIALQAV